MTDTAHEMTQAEREEFFTGWGPELVGTVFPPRPKPRTETSCRAVNCACAEWADGPVIGGYPSCHVCLHTRHSHLQPKVKKRSRR